MPGADGGMGEEPIVRADWFDWGEHSREAVRGLSAGVMSTLPDFDLPTERSSMFVKFDVLLEASRPVIASARQRYATSSSGT